MDTGDIGGIKIFCQVPYIKIAELECEEAVNEHAILRTKLHVSKETITWLERNTLCDQIIKIEIMIQGESCVPLVGLITYAQWETVNGQSYVIIYAISTTSKMDAEKEICVYQRMNRTYKDLLEAILKKYNGTIWIKNKEKLVSTPLLQYQKTDWEFIKQVASLLGEHIFVSASNQTPSLSLGCSNKQIHITNTIVSHKESVSQKGFLIQTSENYMLGEQVMVSDKLLFVLNKKTKLWKGCIEYSYFVGNVKKSIVDFEYEGLAIRGKAVEVTAEHIKLDFGRNEERVETKYKFGYSFYPISGNVMYAMPELGAEVELYFPSTDMKQAYIRNCFLSSLEWPDESQKIMKTHYGKLMSMEPGAITWAATSKEKTQTLRLQDRRGVHLSSSENINFYADGNITLQAGMSCMITASNTILMEQGNTTNFIKLVGDCIQMSSQRYETSSSEKGGKIRRSQTEFVSEGNSTELQQYALAAIPYTANNPLTEQALASIPMLFSNSMSKKSRTGYSG